MPFTTKQQQQIAFQRSLGHDILVEVPLVEKPKDGDIISVVLVDGTPEGKKVGGKVIDNTLYHDQVKVRLTVTLDVVVVPGGYHPNPSKDVWYPYNGEYEAGEEYL